MLVHTLNGQFDFIIQRPQHESKPQCLARLGLFPGTPVNPEHAFTNQVMADQTMFCLEANVNVTDYWKVRQKTSWPKGPFSCPRNTIQEAWRHWRLATRKMEALVPITESSGALHGALPPLLVHCTHCPFTADPLPIRSRELPIHVLCRTCSFLLPLPTSSLLVRQYALFLTRTLITASQIHTTLHILSLGGKQRKNKRR
jgi:hypothetical protein